MKRFVSIKWKFLAVCLAFLIFPTAILGGLIYQTYYHETINNARRDLVLIASGWQTTADVYREELQRILKREEVLVEKRLESLALGTKQVVEFFDEVGGGDLKGARFQALLDKVAGVRIGRSGYVFIIDGQGRYVLSKDRKFDGMIMPDFRRGDVAETYRVLIDEARKLGKDEVKVEHYSWADPGQANSRVRLAALTYVPGKDLLIGACAYYTDFKSYELERILADDLKSRMATQRIGDHGYVFVLDKAGKFLVSKDRLRDGESVSDYRDDRGVYVFRALIARVKALAVGETFFTDYTWKDLDDQRPQRKIAAVVYHPGWGWTIGASAYEKDFLKGLAAIRWSILQVCLGFILLGTIVALFFATHISRPIRQLEGVASRGDLNVSMDPRILSSNDEIGKLGVAFGNMMINLREKIGELERSRQELVLKNEELQRAQQQLFQSEKLAAIGQLAAGVAHEVNNPLAYVTSNMETLEQYIKAYEEVIVDLEKFIGRQAGWRSPDDARADLMMYTGRMRALKFEQIRADISALISELQGGLARVKRIVMDLRTFSRSEYEEAVEVRIEDVLEQVITIVWAQIKYRADLIRDYGKVPLVRCQVQRIGQVFMNILVNAVQAIRQPRGMIQVRTYTEGQMVCVDITDNGEGIARECLARVFEPFFTTKPVGQGTGLGLSISYEIVKKHGGDIRVTSDPKKGTVFTVLLPTGPDLSGGA